MDLLHYSDLCEDLVEVNECLKENLAPNQLVSKILKLCNNSVSEIHKALITINPPIQENDNELYLLAEDVMKVFELLT